MSKYFQTWAIISTINRRSKWRGYIIRFLCWFLTGHELSKTEWGYGGGGKVDRWCRWCNKHFNVDADAFWFENKNFRKLGPLVGKDTPEYLEEEA